VAAALPDPRASPRRRRRRTNGDHRIGMDAAAGLAPARPRRAAAAARRLGHLAGGVDNARAPGPGPCRRLDGRRGHRRNVAGLGLAEPAGTQSPPGQPRQPADAGAGPVLADRGRAGRSGLGRVGHRRRRVRPHRPAGPVADPALPGRLSRRVLVATPSRDRPSGPPAPRPGGRRPGRQDRLASDPAPHRAGRLAPAMAAHHQPRRGTADHHQPRKRPRHPHRGQQRRDRRETRAHPRPALWPDRLHPPPSFPAS